ncbi:MAG: acetyl-CoA C-acetyltransferase [Dehalococcoidales bacterium]|nr:acetyl-CoA C-acetyltransferase [Dehalococcoidales bacterium]
MNEAVIVSGVRTAIGNYGGALQDVPAVQLGATVIKGALNKVNLKPKGDTTYEPTAFKGLGLIDLEKKYYKWDASAQEVMVDEVIMGNVVQAGQGQNPARQAAIYAGVPKEVNAFTVNKICASGMKAVALAAQSIKAGDASCVIAGGIENMSSVPYYVPKMRWGARMFNAEMVDGMVYDGLWEIFNNYHMGVTAENIAVKYNISRNEQDEFALESNNRAIAATKNGIFKEEIVPVEVRVKREVKAFDVDEHPRETSMELLGKLGTAFPAPNPTVTAGNASAITDAGAALVIMSAEKAKQLGLTPIVSIKAYATGGVDPAYMGIGVVPATRKVLKLAGLELKNIDYFELNEAFAAQSLGCLKELNIPTSKVNLHGGGISLGHPIGCTGARIIVTLMNEMKRRSLRYGLAALCIGGGQGMAIIVEQK